MAGIRLTLDRKWPALFIRHPPPWRLNSFRGAEASSVTDGRGRVVAAGSARRMQYRVMDLYAYVAPHVGITGVRRTRGLPEILLYNPLPWRDDHAAFFDADDLTDINPAVYLRLYAADGSLVGLWNAHDRVELREYANLAALERLCCARHDRDSGFRPVS